jgi:DNA-directed RNA polymerase subunit RPC12/RpoP
MRVCTKCSKSNQDHYRFCLGCGAELQGAGTGDASEVLEFIPKRALKCDYCGARIGTDARKCEECGAPVKG